MRIGEAARVTGLTIKAIRHYEAVGLLPDVARVGRYRDFTALDVDRLALIAHCRSLGFSIEQIREVVRLVAESAPECPPADAMRALVAGEIARVEEAIDDLRHRHGRLVSVARYLDSRPA
jgi:DNA-binding transcriptional MerR regulator